MNTKDCNNSDNNVQFEPQTVKRTIGKRLLRGIGDPSIVDRMTRLQKLWLCCTTGVLVASTILIFIVLAYVITLLCLSYF